MLRLSQTGFDRRPLALAGVEILGLGTIPWIFGGGQAKKST